MKLDINNCCLLIIDLQEKLLPHIFNKEKIKHHSSKLVELFIDLNIPIIFTEQYPKGLGHTVPELGLSEASIKAYPKTCFSMVIPELMKELRGSYKYT